MMRFMVLELRERKVFLKKYFTIYFMKFIQNFLFHFLKKFLIFRITDLLRFQLQFHASLFFLQLDSAQV